MRDRSSEHDNKCPYVCVYQEQELKLAADSVLCEVRRKQADVKRMQDIMRSLEKLRKLRKEAASRKGESFLFLTQNIIGFIFLLKWTQGRIWYHGKKSISCFFFF